MLWSGRLKARVASKGIYSLRLKARGAVKEAVKSLVPVIKYGYERSGRGSQERGVIVPTSSRVVESVVVAIVIGAREEEWLVSRARSEV